MIGTLNTKLAMQKEDFELDKPVVKKGVND